VAGVTITPLGAGRYRLTDDDGRSAIAWAAGSPSARWVFHDGRVYVIRPDDTPTAHSARDEMALAAPMPAKVVSVNATPGQTVTRGDVLVVLEAMKMELPIAAPRDGRVRSIGCRLGELVQPGVPLVDLE
jgi:biotin carboxyl carrier protein